MFTQIVLIAAIKWFLYNTIKNKAGIILAAARSSWAGVVELALQAHARPAAPKSDLAPALTCVSWVQLFTGGFCSVDVGKMGWGRQ